MKNVSTVPVAKKPLAVKASLKMKANFGILSVTALLLTDIEIKEPKKNERRSYFIGKVDEANECLSSKNALRCVAVELFIGSLGFQLFGTVKLFLHSLVSLLGSVGDSPCFFSSCTKIIVLFCSVLFVLKSVSRSAVTLKMPKFAFILKEAFTAKGFFATCTVETFFMPILSHRFHVLCSTLFVT